MKRIEVTPAKVIEMRLLENRDRNLTKANQVYRLAKYLPVPDLPNYPSVTELFGEHKPWWTKYREDLWIPEILLFSLLDRKSEATPEKHNTDSVYWSERIDDITNRYGIWPHSVWPKQKSSYFEYGFARALIADIDWLNQSENRLYRKNSYNVRMEVEDGFFVNIYHNFLTRLIEINSNRPNQKLLNKYFEK